MADFLSTLQQFESGGRNIPNTTRGTSSGQAQGFNQITTGTWKEFGGTAYAPTPLQATQEQQNAIAAKIPMGRWAPETLAYLRNNGFSVDPHATLAENIAANHGTLGTAPPPHSTTTPVSPPTTPGTTLTSLPAASSSGALPGFGTKAASDDFLAGLKKAGITPNQGDQAQSQQPNMQPSPIMSGPGLRNAASPQSIGMQAAQMEPQLTGYSPGMYGQSLNSQPLAWSTNPIGAPSRLSKAGPQQAQGLGTSLNSLQMAYGLSPQQMQMMMNPMMLDQGGGYG